jgi:hypothetical protein
MSGPFVSSNESLAMSAVPVRIFISFVTIRGPTRTMPAPTWKVEGLNMKSFPGQSVKPPAAEMSPVTQNS